jgi:hypothetical protein
VVGSSEAGTVGGSETKRGKPEMVLVRRATYTLLAAFVALTLLPAQPAAAEETVYRLIVTPQVWFANIPMDLNQNSVASGTTTTTRPARTLYPQWGGNIALQAGTWTFAVGSLATEYTMIRDTTGGGLPGNTQDRIEMSRWDTDFAVSYTFLDVIQDVMDFTIGVGAKFIRVTGSYQITTPGLVYARTSRIRESFTENIYGPTIPMSFNFHLTKSLFLPVSVTGFVAQDEYSSTFGTDVTETAYGGTGDVALRYIFSNGVAVTGGYRGQALQGGPLGQFGAHGPFFSMSVPFNF